MTAEKFNAEAAWNDALALLRANREIAGAISGIFLFLPTLAFGLLGTPFDVTALSDAAKLPAAIAAFLAANWMWMLLVSLCSWLAVLAIYVHVSDAARPTVSEAFGIALRLLPFYIVTQLLTGIPILLGIYLLVLPGLYLFVRWSPIAAVIAVERVSSPIAAIRRSWQLTKGHSIRFGFFLIFVIIMTYLLQTIFGIALSLPLLLLPPEISTPGSVVITSFIQSVAALFLFFIFLASYRQLAALKPPISAR